MNTLIYALNFSMNKKENKRKNKSCLASKFNVYIFRSNYEIYIKIWLFVLSILTSSSTYFAWSAKLNYSVWQLSYIKTIKHLAQKLVRWHTDYILTNILRYELTYARKNKCWCEIADSEMIASFTKLDKILIPVIKSALYNLFCEVLWSSFAAR